MIFRWRGRGFHHSSIWKSRHGSLLKNSFNVSSHQLSVPERVLNVMMMRIARYLSRYCLSTKARHHCPSRPIFRSILPFSAISKRGFVFPLVRLTRVTLWEMTYVTGWVIKKFQFAFSASSRLFRIENFLQLKLQTKWHLWANFENILHCFTLL